MTITSPHSDVQLPDSAITPFVMKRAAALGDKPALIDGPSGRTLTFAGLDDAIRRCAAGLAERGFGHGDVMAIYAPNAPEYAVAFHAVASLGGVNTTVNPLYTADELSLQLEDSGAAGLFTVGPFLDKARAAAGGTGVREVFVFDEAEGATPLVELLSTDASPPDANIDPATDLAVLPYSSGTTGLPKGVMLTHGNLVANICQTLPVLDIREDDVIIGVLPFFHIYGMQVVMNLAVGQGATVVTMPRFDLEQFLALLQDHRVTIAYLVPPIVLALAKHPAVDGFDLSALRFIMSGAAPLGPELQQECAERLGCIVMQGYGLTETSPVTHVNPPEANRPGSVGPSLPQTDCRIVDPESGTDVEAGATGELWIRGPQVMTGYLNNEAATKESIDPDGWFRTGDLAAVDEAGYFVIVDRLKELIKYKGFQVAPAELEALLLSHPAVADAAVIPSPDEEAGEVPKAFIVAAAEAAPDPAELMEWAARSVAPHKKVRRLEIVDEIPKSASGKILRRLLVERERAGQRPG